MAKKDKYKIEIEYKKAKNKGFLGYQVSDSDAFLLHYFKIKEENDQYNGLERLTGQPIYDDYYSVNLPGIVNFVNQFNHGILIDMD